MCVCVYVSMYMQLFEYVPISRLVLPFLLAFLCHWQIGSVTFWAHVEESSGETYHSQSLCGIQVIGF